VLRRALGAECALAPGSRVLIAASGGADSTALLAGLASLAGEFGLALEAAHLHHRLRGREADLDLEAVRALCVRLGVPLTVARWNTRARMRRRGLSGQNGLRTLRREFLLAAARARGCDAIATAHTADDQLETLLMRLGRGAGLAGLAGIRPRAGRFVRPLLLVPRAWIEADLARARMPWREDPSNADPRYARSRIRHEVVPRLAEIAGAAGRRVARAPRGPRSGAARARGSASGVPGSGGGPASSRPALVAGIARRAARAAAEAGAAETWLRARVRRALPAVCRIQPGAVDLDSMKVAPWPSALRRTALREVWRRATGAGTGLTARHLDALERLTTAGRPGAQVALPDDMMATRERRLVRFRRRGRFATPPRDGQPARRRRVRDERTLRRGHGVGQAGAADRAGR
jgi:tRNA(Ile)-lysidine synthetase-like protein